MLDLPEEVVLYLQEDGVVLPKGFEISCGFGIADDSDDEVDWDDNNEDTCDGVSSTLYCVGGVIVSSLKVWPSRSD